LTSSNSPYFSVIIPVYNRKSFIVKAITSVLDQTYTDFEVVCVDDGSTDNTVNLITEIQRQDTRVRLISLKKNKGRCIARNEGVNLAKTKWICFLDSDDYYLDNHLATLSDLIKKNPIYNAFSTSQRIENSNSSAVFHTGQVLDLNSFLRSNMVQLNQLCVSKDHCPQFANERIPISEDWLFMRQLTLNHHIYCSNEITNVLVNHNNRSVNSADWSEFTKWNVYTGVLFANNQQLPISTKRKILSFTYLLAANILLSKSLKNKSWRYFIQSLGYFNSYYDPLLYKCLIKYIVK
jgi:glycosyltransferase involved in cell wall biosynthesis